MTLNISKLIEWKYLKPEQVTNATITWSANGSQTGRISIRVNMLAINQFVELDYKYGEEPRKYKVGLVSIPSNLGKGVVWYFLCPETSKRCRKLYSIDGYFLHRDAFNGCMYETQTQSKKNRQMIKVLGPYFKSDELYRELNKKHFKKTYAGKPTKKYMRLTELIRQAESIPYHEIERLMLI